jgi:hypothetical protein
MRLDQYPDNACLSGSGLPVPVCGDRAISLISALMR